MRRTVMEGSFVSQHGCQEGNGESRNYLLFFIYLFIYFVEKSDHGVCVCVSLHVSVCVCVLACLGVCVCVLACLDVCVCRHACLGAHMCIYVYVRVTC